MRDSRIIGKVDSQVIGAQIGANLTKNFLLTVGYDSVPWHTDSVFLPKNVTCSNANYQISAKSTLAYFLPLNTAQCFNNPNGTTSIYYGGWAGPYTDNTTSDPFYTTNFLQGQPDRRAPGNSWQATLTFTSTNQKWIVQAADAWYDYGNALGPENTKIWWFDGRYRFSHVGKGPYHGLLLALSLRRALPLKYVLRRGRHELSGRFCDRLDGVRRSSDLQVQPRDARVRLLKAEMERLLVRQTFFLRAFAAATLLALCGGLRAGVASPPAPATILNVSYDPDARTLR